MTLFIVGSCLQVDPIPHSFNSFSSPPPPPPPPPHTRFKGLLIHTRKVDHYLPHIKSIIFYHFSFEYVIFYLQEWNYHISFEYNFHIQDAQGPEIEIQKRIPFLLIFVVLSFFFFIPETDENIKCVYISYEKLFLKISRPFRKKGRKSSSLKRPPPPHTLRFLCEIDQKVSILVEKLKKMQPLKMTFRSQLEPSIKSYECFMFFLNFRLEMTLD